MRPARPGRNQSKQSELLSEIDLTAAETPAGTVLAWRIVVIQDGKAVRIRKLVGKGVEKPPRRRRGEARKSGTTVAQPAGEAHPDS